MVFGVGEVGEGLLHAVEPDAPGDQRGHVDAAVGDVGQGVGEFLRAVVGGTGKFAGVRGQVIQTYLGSNSSQLRGRFLPDGLTVPSPNFRFRFELYFRTTSYKVSQ